MLYKQGCWLEMRTEALQVAKAYRHLLKAVKNQVSKEETKRHFRDYVTEEFRNNYKLSDLYSIQQKIKHFSSQQCAPSQDMNQEKIMEEGSLDALLMLLAVAILTKYNYS